MAALQQEADRLANAGDPRTRGQVMADTVFERVTGRSTADPARLEVQLVMTDRALLQGGNEPAWLTGYGIVPAQYARDLIRLPQDPPRTGRVRPRRCRREPARKEPAARHEPAGHELAGAARAAGRRRRRRGPSRAGRPPARWPNRKGCGP